MKKGGGGGGRISVVLTNAASFSSFTGAMTAYGGAVAGHFGTAGTVYRKTPADAGFVIIDNNNVLPDKTWVTTGFPSQNYLTENLKLTQWTIQNRGWPQLTTNLTLKSFTLAANTRLELGGYTLTLSALTVTGVVYKSGTYTTNSTSIFTDAIGGGKVVVTSQGTAAFFR